MRISRIIGAAGMTAALCAPAYFLLGRSTGAPPRKTGGPGDTTCADAGCHGGRANSGSGKVEINFGGATTYTPGQTQTWTVTITDSAARAWGFEVSARPASNETNGQAGRFEPAQNQRVLCENDQDRSGSCPAAQPLEFLTHNLPSSTNTFTVSWKAPDTNVGDVKVYVAGNAANGNFSNTGDLIYTASYTLTAAGGGGGSAVQAIQVWDRSTDISAGTWLELYGQNLSNTTRTWEGAFDGNKAPTVLDGVRVNINSKPAFISYISPGQVNVQSPDDDAIGPVKIDVINPSGTTSSVTVQKAKVSPALLTTPAFLINGKQYVIAQNNPDTTAYVGPQNLIAGLTFRPAKVGDTITLYAVGCGPSNPASPAGEIQSAAKPLALPYQVRFGQVQAEAQGFLTAVGLCQFNVKVPSVAAGDTPIDLVVDGVATGQTLVTTVGN